MADRIGQELGNYRLTRLLGEGGFAQVYLGEHLYLATQAAIKVLDLRLAVGELDTFYSEARTIARLTHPHIVHVLEFGVQERTPFLVMEYAPGGTVRERFPKGTRPGHAVVLSYVLQVASALQYAHDHQLVHRDVKPENLLLGRDGALWLSDFGVAIIAQTSQHHTTQDIIGTLAYMAPEQLQGKPRPASDQYALGVVVYEWLSGRLPFEGSYREMALQHLLTEPPSLHDAVPAIAPEVERVVLKALAKEPKDRFASVQEFASAFESAYQAAERSAAPLPVAASPSADMEQPTPLATQLHVVVPVPAGRVKRPRGITRREALVGLAGLSAAGAGLVWLLLPSKQKVATVPISPHPPTVVPSTPTTPTFSPPANLLHVYPGHSGVVHTVAWSPDGQRVASGGDDATVQILDALTGSTLVTYRGHTGAVYGVAWSLDGKRLASSSFDTTVHIWEAVDASLLINFSQHTGPVHAVAWSPDGARIASGSDDRTIKLWDAGTGSDILTYGYQGGFTWAVAWSPDGQYIAAGDSRGPVYVYNSSGLLQDSRFPDGNGYLIYAKHSAAVETVAWSPDGKRVASGSLDKRVQVWDAFTGDHVLPHTGQTQGITGISWSHDGQLIASASLDGTVQIWKAATGDTVSTYRGHRGSVWTVAWSPDGTRLASGGADGTVQIWQAP